MGKVYQVQLFNTEDGGHLLASGLFNTAKEAREEFIRIRDEIYEPDAQSGFCSYRTDDYDLFLTPVTLGEKLKTSWNGKELEHSWFHEDYKKPEKLKKIIENIDVRFTTAVEERWFPTKKSVYDSVSFWLDIVNVTHGRNFSQYEIEITGYNRTVYVYVDLSKKRHVISGSPWKGYIISDKEKPW